MNEPLKVVQSRHGLIIANPNDTYIGRALIKYGEYSEPEVKLIFDLAAIKPGAMVEVGANCGALTLPMAKYADANGKDLYAFEPQPDIYRMLQASLVLNDITDVEVVKAAVGAIPGVLYVPHVDYSKEGNFGAVPVTTKPTSIQVPSVTLDAYFGGAQIGFIKIDVEGWELEVLKGSAHILEHQRPVMLVENDRLEKSEALIKYLQDADYRLWWSVINLYNLDNFFGENEDIYPNIASFNMVCVPRELNLSIKGMEITDPTQHILKQSTE
jgi:FkbM family methyltransferase